MEIIHAEINLEWNYDTFNTECPICTNSLYEPSVESKTSNVSINCCKHGYHTECIDRWLKTKRNCPMCKTVWKEKNNNQDIPQNDTSNNFTQNDIIYINAPPQGVYGQTDSILRNFITRLNNLREDN